MPLAPKKRPLLQPFVSTRKVAPYDGTTLVMPVAEHALFDSVAQEHVHIVGTEIDYFSHQVPLSVRDPLYDEPIDRAYSGPFKIKIYITWPETAFEVDEKGWRALTSAEAWIPRKEVEDKNCPAPTPTDVMRVWNTPFFNEWSVAGLAKAGIPVPNTTVPNAGYFFDILSVVDDGHLFDSPQFVGFKLEIKRRTEFTPERRVTNT